MKSAYKGIKKIVIGLIGVSVIIIGIILLPLPGPGWVVIFAGLVILSTEFERAKKLKDKLGKYLKDIMNKARNQRKEIDGNSSKNTDRTRDNQSKRKN